MRKILLILVAILVAFLFVYGHGYADERPTFDYFKKAVEKQAKENGRPEIVYRTENYVVVIFGLENSMKEFRYDRSNDSYRVTEIRKLEDSTKSEFHQTPDERLEEAIKYLGE